MKKVKGLSLATFFALFIVLLSGFVQHNKPDPDPEKYFKVFLGKTGNNLMEVFLQHQPQLNDCKAIFKDEYYAEMFRDINKTYAEISEQMDTQNERFKDKTACRANPFNTNDMIANKCNECPGIMKKMQMDKKFRPNIVCYRLQFLETTDSKYGSSYAYFAFLNGHWVYFPTN